MQGIKLVAFDATNTLLKFRIPPWQHYGIVAKDYGFKGSTELLKTQIFSSFKVLEKKHPNFGRNDVTWENWWRKLVKLSFQGLLPPNADTEKLANKLISDFRTSSCWTIADGTQKLLELLNKNNISVGIISNFDPRLEDILKNLCLDSKFDFIVTSYDVGYSKPDKRIFDRAIEVSKKMLLPSECLHIGDDFEKDYRGAKEAGWHALLLAPSGTKHTPESSKHVFQNIQQLYETFEQNKVEL